MECPTPNCVCREAVTRTFRELRDRGVTDSDALESAINVYRYHHPTADGGAARTLIAAWTNH